MEYNKYYYNKCMQKFYNEVLINDIIEFKTNSYVKLEGKILSEHSHKCIRNACVKITDLYFTPIEHTYTDKKGRFFIVGKFPKNIRILVYKKRYKLLDIGPCNTMCLTKGKIELCLNRDKECTNSVHGKIIVHSKFPYPIISVTLINHKSKSKSYETFTNNYGDFMFVNVKKGSYSLRFQSQYVYTVICKVKLKMKKDIEDLGCFNLKYRKLKGTVNGIIENNLGIPLKDAVVLLYDACKNKPIKITYTNRDGAYLFSNVNRGDYFIKAIK